MIFIAFASFPPENIKIAAKVFLTLKVLPNSVKRVGPYFKIDPDAPIEIITIYEFDPDYIDKAKKFLEARYKAFAEVPGFLVKIEARLDMQEALLRLQLK